MRTVQGASPDEDFSAPAPHAEERPARAASRSTQPAADCPFRPHDLLRLSRPDAIEAIDAPAWVAASLERAPWVVVRRAATMSGRVAVGVRGATRAERCAAWVVPEDVVEQLSPEDLAVRPPPRPHPAFDAMTALRAVLDGAHFNWGPAGAVGYELATGNPTLTDASDLDLVLRVAERPRDVAFRKVAEAAERLPIRIDILIETLAGGVALDELLGDAPDILLRTPHGPRLVPRANLFAPDARE